MAITDKDAQRAVEIRARQAEVESDVRKMRQELDHLYRELLTIEGPCDHSWTKPERRTKHHKGYVIPASYMGSDSRPETRVPPTTEVWHVRTCMVCGKTEKSTGTKPGKPVPSFN